MSGSNFLFLLIRDPWALTLVLLISLVPTGILGWGLYVDYRIANEGTSIQAAVTYQRAISNHNRHGRTSYRYNVEYEFRPPGEPQMHTAYWMHDAFTVTVPKADYDRAEDSKRLEVLYVPDSPELNRPKNCNTTNSIVVFFAVFVGVDLVALAGVFGALHYREKWRQRQMQAAGVSTGSNASYQRQRDNETWMQEDYPVDV